MKKTFDQKEISRLVGVSAAQVRYWERAGLIPAIGKDKGKPLFDFKGLVAFRTAKRLLERGFSTRKIRRSVRKIKQSFPHLTQPLSELRLLVKGKQLIFCQNDVRFDSDGQLLLDFDSLSFPATLTDLRPVESWFFQGLECEENQQWEKAQRFYETVLERKPNHSDSLVNLGNIYYRMGNIREAETRYRLALRADPDHVEANYNLANLLARRNNFQDAILFYSRAIHDDPEFADAYFNLGGVLLETGEIQEAKKYWRHYLQIDPSSRYAEYVKKQLKLLGEKI